MAVATVRITQQIDRSQVSTITEGSSCVSVSKDGRLLTGHESIIHVWSECLSSQEWSLLHSINTPVQGDVTCISIFPSNEHLFATSMNNCIAIYDMRQLLSCKPLRTFCFNSDEINQLDINHKGTFLCACDDSGEIKVIDIENGKLFKTLSRCHTNICSSVKFNLRKTWEIVSGGLDCQIVRWDFSLGRPLCSLSTQDPGDVHSDTYMVNPPMVHSIVCVPSKFGVVCGLGSGAVAVYEMKAPKSLVKKCTSPLHRSGVGSLCVLDSPQTLREPMIISGGNDGRICVSRLTKATDTPQSQCSKYDISLKLMKMVEIEHRHKVNFMCVVPLLNEQNDRLVSFYVFVSDPSSFVSRYKIMC